MRSLAYFALLAERNHPDNFAGSNGPRCLLKCLPLATVNGTNPLMKMAVAPNLDHGKKVRGEKTHTHTHTQSDTLTHTHMECGLSHIKTHSGQNSSTSHASIGAIQGQIFSSSRKYGFQLLLEIIESSRRKPNPVVD